jgi:hypothetical protein
VDASGEIISVSCIYTKYAEMVRQCFINLSSDIAFLISANSTTYHEGRKHTDVSRD